MNKLTALFLVFILVSCSFSLGPGIKVAIKQSTITAIKDQIVAYIMKQLHDITANDIEGNAGPIHYHIHDIRAHLEPLPPENVHIILVPNSNQVRASIGGIRASGHCRIDYKILFISGGFDGDADVHDVGVETGFAFGYDGEGRPTAAMTGFDIGISDGNVNLSFHGDILGELVNFLANFLKPVFVGLVRAVIDNTVPALATKMINDMIRTLPMSVDIGPNMAITYKLPQNPWVNADYFCAAISGYIYYKPNPHPPNYEPRPCPDYDASSQKGLHFFLTDYVIRSALDASFEADLLNVVVSVTVANYDVSLNCKAKTAPILTFNSAVSVTAGALCEITATNKQSGEKMNFGLSADMLVNLKEYIKEQTLFFEILQISLSNMQIDNPNKYDLKWFEDSLNQILQAAADFINIMLGQRGIKLPSIQGITYADIEEAPKDGYIETLVTPIINIAFEKLAEEAMKEE